jgi:hypothetical protein
MARTAYPGDWGRYLEAVQGGVVVVQFWAILSLLYVFPSGLPEAAWTRLAYRLFTAWFSVAALLGVVRPGAARRQRARQPARARAAVADHVVRRRHRRGCRSVRSSASPSSSTVDAAPTLWSAPS